MSKPCLARRVGTITAFAISVAATVTFAFSSATVSAATPDPLIDQQWGLADIGASQVWSQSTGVGVTVAIIDGGSGPHPDLDANLDPGQSIIGGNRTSGGADIGGSDGHGTEVAGIIAAVNGNGIGISGVAPNARLLPLRVFPADGGSSSSSDVASAIRFAVDSGAKIINLSLGSDSESPQITTAVAYAVDHDVLVVAAAGNNGPNFPPSWPAADDNTIAVTAVDEQNIVASFGRRGDYIDLSAPGVNIMSTKTADFTCKGANQPAGYGCHSVSGTSFAAPFVSGAAALIFSARPNLTSAQVRALLLSTATDLGSPGRDTTYGVGLLNLPAAFAAMNAQYPVFNDPLIASIGRINSVATGTAPTLARSPQLQWYRCKNQGSATSTVPVECVSIANAVALTYQITQNDLRLFLRLAVSTTTGGATTTVLSATSPKVIGVWLKVDSLARGSTNNF
ncbi:MAG: S8 family serine peptidase, partial [Ilumatobacteraceae bacterium]